MARTTPVVQAETVIWSGETHAYQIAVDTPAWYTWLEEVSTFAFVSDRGSFTARKEPKQHSGSYWRAYRKRDGKLHRAYLGKSHDVTLERLNTVAALLSGQSDTSDQRASSTETMQVPHAPSTAVSVAQPLIPLEYWPKQTLPLPLPSFIGREQDIMALIALLGRPTVRLLTLTGTAGVGKTRLSLQVAAALTHAFVDGVCFVSLAPLKDPELVLPAVTQALKLPEARGRSPLEHLQAALHEQHLLLLLDNFEQVAEAAPLLVVLLQSCPNLKIIVTSRTSLRVRGVYDVRVSPLDLPDLKQRGDLETLAHNASVALFTQLAQASVLDFALTEANASTIAEICVHLDGLPLALELAAARIKLLSPHQLLSRLEHRLEALTGGAQDLPLRQQTLRNTLQWSYDLLSPEEQWLFRLLSVFVDGCTVEAVEALCQALQHDMTAVLDGLQRLLDNNLIFQSKLPDGEMRLMMLETIREYGQECLTRSEEAEMTQQVHAEYYLALVEKAEPCLYSWDQLQWLERLEQEYANLRAAVNHLLQRERFELALRLTGPLWFFWALRAHIKEGQDWLDRALAAGGDVSVLVRAKALYAAAATRYFQGQWEEGLSEESLRLYRQAGDKRGIATVLNGLGHLALRKGNAAAAKVLCEESLPLFQEVQDRRGVAETLLISSYSWYAQGAYAQARAVCEESLAIVRGIGDRWATAYALQNLGYCAYQQGDYALACAHYKESLETSKVLSELWITTPSLAGLGEVATAQGQFTWAAQLWGAAENLCETLGIPLIPIDRAAYESAMATTSMHLGEKAFTALWAEGRTISLDQILANQEPVSSLRQPHTTPPTASVLPSTSDTGLTPREMDVLRLLAQGLTSVQMAEQLIIGVVTVNFHVRAIYSKLGVSSRSAATRYAIEHHLV